MGKREARKADKKNRIVQAAAGILARKGFKGTVMADIAAAAGTGKGTLYEYFNSKEALFFAVFEWFSNEITSQAELQAAAHGDSVAERLLALSHGVLGALDHMAEFYTLFMEFWAASATSANQDRFKQAFKNGYQALRGLVAGLIREGMASGEFSSDLDAEAIAAGIVGTWDALGLQLWFEAQFDIQATGRAYFRALLHGMAKPASPKEDRNR